MNPGFAIKNLCMGLALILSSLALAPTAAADAHAPENIVRKTTEGLLKALRANPEIYKTDRKTLMDLVETVLMPSLDFPLTSRLVLGRYWRRASENQQARFVRSFRDMLLRTYTTPLLEYADDVDIAFQPSNEPEDNRATVRTTLSFSGRDPVPVFYSMRRKEDGWKAYDVVIGGVSAVVTFRASFGEDIKKQGLEAFLNSLEAHNAQLLANDQS